MSRRTGYRAVWVLSCVALVVMVALFARVPLAIPAPAEMVAYSTQDRTLMLNHPANWKPHSMSMHAVMSEVWFEPARGLYMDVQSDLQGSLMADLSRSTGNMAESFAGLAGQAGLPVSNERMRKSPLEKLHEMQGTKMAAAYKDKGYGEGITTKLKLGGQDALMTDFQFQKRSMFSSRPMAGARITSLHSDRRIVIIYQYPRAVQAQVEPVFKAIAASVRVGQGDRP